MEPDDVGGKKKRLRQLERESLALRLELASSDGRVTFTDSIGCEWTMVDVMPSADSRLASDDYGMTLPDSREVLINPDKPRAGIAATRFHELIHAAMQHNWTLNDAMEESIVRSLEKHLYPVLVQFGLRLDWPARRTR